MKDHTTFPGSHARALSVIVALAVPATAYRVYADFLSATRPLLVSDFWRRYPAGVDPDLLTLSTWATLFAFTALVALGVSSIFHNSDLSWSVAHKGLVVGVSVAAAVVSMPVGAMLTIFPWFGTGFFVAALAVALGCVKFNQNHPSRPVLPSRDQVPTENLTGQ